MKRFLPLLTLFIGLMMGACSNNTEPELDKPQPVKLSTPVGLAVDSQSVTSTSMAVAWEALSDDSVAAYSVEWKRIDDSEFSATDVYTNKAVISGLQHSTTYLLRLRAKSSHGAEYDSDYTDNVEAETLLIYEVAAPTNIRVVEDKSTSTSLTIEWDAVENTVGYIISYKKRGTDEAFTVEVDGPNAVLRGLEADTEYDVSVLSCSRSGQEYNSSYSEALVVKTTLRVAGIASATDFEAFAASLEKEYAETGVATGADWADENGVVNILNDIDMKGVNWTPISNFGGTLDGKGFKIENLNLVSHSAHAALFVHLTGATVRNLVFAESCSFATTATSETQSYVSTVAAIASQDSVLENITSYASLSNGVNMGGVVASADQKDGTVLFKNCTNYGAITYPEIVAPGNVYIGGICSFCEIGVTFDGCANHGTLSDSSMGGNKFNIVGGIIGGGTEHEMYNCTNAGAIKFDCRGSNNIYGGGMVGRCFRMHAAENCSNSGTLSITESSDCVALYLSGCFGSVEGTAKQTSTITKCTNSANITAMCNNSKDMQIGGIMGWIKVTGCTISDCSNSGNLTMTSNVTGSYVAGIVTVQSSTVADSNIKTVSSILNCKNTGNISYIGTTTSGNWSAPVGICGKCTKDFYIEGCENYGNVTADTPTRSNPGGIGSEINCDVVNCTNYGTVTSASTHADYYSGTAGIVSRYQQAGTVISGCVNHGTIIYNGKGFTKANANKGIVGQGGICAVLYNGAVENCENYGTVLGNDYDSSNGLASYINAKGSIVGWGGNNAAVTIKNCKVGGSIGVCVDTDEDMGASKATALTAENYAGYIYGGDAKNGVTVSGCSFAAK